MVQDGVLVLEGGVTLNIAELSIEGELELSGDTALSVDTLNVLDGGKVSIKKEEVLRLEIPSINISEFGHVSADLAGYCKNSGPGAPVPDEVTGYTPGASYGGLGSWSGNPGPLYGSALKPVDFGSGGSYGKSPGSEACGGGAIRIISEDLVNNGTISANSGMTSSGGSVYITTDNISGTGSIEANGRKLGFHEKLGHDVGPGGGGRVAVYYDNSTYEGEVSAKGGEYCYSGCKPSAGDGTAVMIDVPNNDMYIQNAFRFEANESPFNYKNIYTNENARVEAVGGVVLNADKMPLALNASLYLIDNPEINIADVDLGVGAILSLSGDEKLDIKDLYLEDGAKVTITPNEKVLTLDIPDITLGGVNSSIDADSKGSCERIPVEEPDNIHYGASHGGVGGGQEEGSIYGSKEEPSDFGRSGHYGKGCGGGAIRIISDNFVNEGSVTADAPYYTSSGGSIYVTVKNLSGDGVFHAKGGEKSYSKYQDWGAGGRIAVYYDESTFDGVLDPAGGNKCSYSGCDLDDGTKVYEQREVACTPGEDIDCNSSVIFIPGFEGSRLYKERALFGEDQLWETLFRSDIRELFMDPTTGESENPNIYTNDIIKKSNVGFLVLDENIYKSFSKKLDGIVKDGLMAEWKAFPYDWRKSVKDVVEESVKMKDGTYGMITEIEKMASKSNTSKVTLVGHSNGGLVTKQIMLELEKLGKADLVDKIILVASPQLGTPESVLVGLHGVDLVHGFLDKANIRELGENMKGFYGLLPREKYFENLPTPVRPIIEFGEGEATEELRNIYGDTINTYAELKSFILGDYGLRVEPEKGDVNEPNVLKEHLLDEVLSEYYPLEDWMPLDSVDLIEIIGWGFDTIRGIKYYSIDNENCLDSSCENAQILDPQPLITSEGDKTVIHTSAQYLGDNRYYLNLREYNNIHYHKPERNGKKHANILEVSNLLDLLNQLILNSEEINIPEFITTTKPTETDPSLRLSVHSPVELHIYDELGRHTGLLEITNEDEVDRYEEQIPNSYYWQIGEGQYAGVSGGYTSTVKLVGIDSGTFDFHIDEVESDEVVSQTIFDDVPVEEGSLAIVEVNESKTIYSLNLDIDGDGEVDEVLEVKEGETFVYKTSEENDSSGSGEGESSSPSYTSFTPYTPPAGAVNIFSLLSQDEPKQESSEEVVEEIVQGNELEEQTEPEAAIVVAEDSTPIQEPIIQEEEEVGVIKETIPKEGSVVEVEDHKGKEEVNDIDIEPKNLAASATSSGIEFTPLLISSILLLLITLGFRFIKR